VKFDLPIRGLQFCPWLRRKVVSRHAIVGGQILSICAKNFAPRFASANAAFVLFGDQPTFLLGERRE
jgi:hypothetical protein